MVVEKRGEEETKSMPHAPVLSTIFQLDRWWSVLLVEETGVSEENHRPAASLCQTFLSHNVVSSTPYHEWDSYS